MWKSKAELKAFIDENVTKDRILWGVILNQLFTDYQDSFKFDFVVADTSARNALTGKYAGMLVYVRNDKLYVLEDDLTTWSAFTKNTYTQAEIIALLTNKVATEVGKGLSANDFTDLLKTKLDAIEAEATKNLSDAALKDRASHTGLQATSTITGLDALIESIQDDLLRCLNSLPHLVKSIAVVSASIYNVDKDTDFTLLVDCSLNNVIIVLPDVNDPFDINDGLCLNIKKIDSSGNTVTIYGYDYQDSDSGSGSQSGTGYTQIEFQDSQTLSAQGDLINIQAYNNNWYKISN